LARIKNAKLQKIDKMAKFFVNNKVFFVRIKNLRIFANSIGV
jgi:hypothetical protein